MQNVLWIVEFILIGGVLGMIGMYFILKHRVKKNK